MLSFFRALCVTTLVKSASASEACSPDDYDDETSILQFVQTQKTATQAQYDPEPTDAATEVQAARGRCSEAMEQAPRIIRRAMFRDDHVNVCGMAVHNLYQDDFRDGTYIIREPGIYRLRENVQMAPETTHMMPAKDSEVYPMRDGYWLGFVAAIAVASDNVFLDLNGKSLAMSPEFLLRQRFFSVVQLGERPFEAAVGPPQFGAMRTSPFWASNVVISDGQLGMTSHTGVHGWLNSNIWINEVHVKDFETAGIQINGATDVYITNTNIGPSLGHQNSAGVVPGLATLSQANLLLRIVEGEDITDPAFDELRDSLERYIDRKLGGLPPLESESFFINEAGIPDGSTLHGIVLHAPRPAIHDFASCPDFGGEDDDKKFGPVTLKNVSVSDLLLGVDEVVSMQAPTSTGGMMPIMGPAGDVFQAFRVRDDDGNYVGNTLSNAQLALGRMKLEHEGDDADETFRLFGATNIPAKFLEWANGAKSWEDMVSEVGVQFVCKKDAMTHFNKGILGVRIEYYRDVSLDGVHITNGQNVGRASEVSHCTGDDLVYSGNDVRGLTMSHVTGLRSKDVRIHGMNSPRGFAYGVEERVEVEYGGFDYDIIDISGGMGSTYQDHGLNGMLDSDGGISD